MCISIEVSQAQVAYGRSRDMERGEDLQVLNKSDVQALNEQELSMQEKDEIRAVWHQAGTEMTRMV